MASEALNVKGSGVRAEGLGNSKHQILEGLAFPVLQRSKYG